MEQGLPERLRLALLLALPERRLRGGVEHPVPRGLVAHQQTDRHWSKTQKTNTNTKEDKDKDVNEQGQNSSHPPTQDQKFGPSCKLRRKCGVDTCGIGGPGGAME